jgi:hypothetical protein
VVRIIVIKDAKQNLLHISFITFLPPTLLFFTLALRKMIISQEQEGLSWGQTFKLRHHEIGNDMHDCRQSGSDGRHYRQD